MKRGFLLGALLAAAGAATSLNAQSDPRLVAIVRESQEGAGDSARAALDRLVASTPAGDPLLPEMLFVGAVIAPTAQEMQRNLQRITVEHALSAWADDALLKLAQLEYASGNLTGSARSLERVRSDYPSSPLIALTSFWAARTYFDMRQQQQACEWVRHGLGRAQAGSDVRGQLVFFAQRCPAIRAADLAPPAPAPGEKPAPPRDTIELAARDSATARDTTPAVVPPQPAPPTVAADSVVPAVSAGSAVPPAARRMVRIQVVAAGTQAMADDAVRRLRALNVESRIVPEGGLLKVRAGAFATRAQAQAALPRIRAEFPGAFPVMDP